MATAYTIATGVDKIYLTKEGEFNEVLLHMSRFNPTVNDTLVLTSAWTAGKKVIALKGQDYSASSIVSTSTVEMSFVRATGILTAVPNAAAADSTDFYVSFKLVI